VLATGGGAGIFTNHLVRDEDGGDGYALAYRVGAEMRNMEFIQFMLGIRGDGIRRFLPLSELKRPGRILDSNGEDLLKTAIPDKDARLKVCEERTKHHPFSTRDASSLIDIAVARTWSGGGKVYWAGEEDRQASLEVVHFSHAFNGGIQIDETGQSKVPNLFAAGEAAAGPHGADRIGGCMMTATQVFGARAGKAAAQRARRVTPSSDRVSPPGPSCETFRPRVRNHTEVALSDLEGEGRRICSAHLMLLRDEDGLNACLAGVKDALSLVESTTDAAWQDTLRVRNALTVTSLVAEAALARKESLGPHFRTDTSSAHATRDPEERPNRFFSSPPPVAGKPARMDGIVGP
jgi:L-aspartate oxidase